MTYDPACYDLAESFLSDEPKLNTQQNRKELASAIQDRVESWIATALFDRSEKEPAK